MENGPMSWTAFDGDRQVASGPPGDVVPAVRAAAARDATAALLVFDASGRVVDLDLRGSDAEILARAGVTQDETIACEPQQRRPGRPRLGVVSREVTLLPRHWEWLGRQPGGASVALRKLVEAARRATAETDRIRHCQDSAYRFMTAMAGDRPGYEDAVRALYANDQAHFDELTDAWPTDIREHARRLAAPAF